jgi:hypothetical protein
VQRQELGKGRRVQAKAGCMADGLIACDIVLYTTPVNVLSTAVGSCRIAFNQECTCDVVLHAPVFLGGLKIIHCHCGTTLAACRVS